MPELSASSWAAEEREREVPAQLCEDSAEGGRTGAENGAGSSGELQICGLDQVDKGDLKETGKGGEG